MLNKHILPTLKDVPVESIKPKMVIDVVSPVKARGNLLTVKSLCRIVNEVIRLAVVIGLIETNFLAEITKMYPTGTKGNMPSIKPDELPELMNTLAFASITRQTRCLIEWLLHTMTCPNETASAKWKDIDLDAKTWTIPAEQMKMGKSHTIPLSEQTMALLEIIKTFSFIGKPYLFAGRRGDG